MKKIIFFITLLPLLASAQSSDYNKWSIELDGGITKPYDALTTGYTTEKAELFVVNFGARYMFNTKFGLKADLGFHDWDSADNSAQFETSYYRGNLQGVINLANVIDTKSTVFKNFGLLVHGGFGASLIDSEINDNDDWTVNAIIGLTPQLKLSNRLTLQADLSILTNISQERNFDGAQFVSTSFIDGKIATATIGLAINLGKNETHADWTNYNPWTDEIEELKGQITKIETDLIDTDQDGVPDYLDREPNTASGASVNTKGITLDLNQNGIPDEFETSLDRKYLKEDVAVDYDDAIKKLLTDGYVNVYFDTNSSNPATYSLDAINYLIKYMTNNPTVNAELIGYADQRGNEAYNTNLSSKRAQKVTTILIDAGIDAARLTNSGNGEASSANSKAALQLQRKVTFKLK